MTLPQLTPLDLQQIAIAFDDDEWVFEVKHDGFRALAYIKDGACQLVGRNNHTCKRFASLKDSMPTDIVS